MRLTPAIKDIIQVHKSFHTMSEAGMVADRCENAVAFDIGIDDKLVKEEGLNDLNKVLAG